MNIVKPAHLVLIMVTCVFAFKSTVTAQTIKKTNPSPANFGETTKILILGNSITHHGPWAPIKWTGDWGMAASSREKDFVHVLIDSLRKFSRLKNIDYREQNIADWENNFNHDFCKDSLLKYKPNILIIRLGENVKDKYARENNYKNALLKLIDMFKGDNTRVIVTGNFWPNGFKDNAQKLAALQRGYIFVDFSDMEADPRNKATGKFEDDGVANHPSDFGMRNIASKIYKAIVDNKLVK